MNVFARSVAATIIALGALALAPRDALAAKGQDFPNHTCTCKGCGSTGGDVTGQCTTVCKDKTVYSKGSEPNDYCKASDAGSGSGSGSTRPGSGHLGEIEALPPGAIAPANPTPPSPGTRPGQVAPGAAGQSRTQ